MDNVTSSNVEMNIVTDNVKKFACRICFTFDNVQDAFQCSYNDESMFDIINTVLLSQFSSNNLGKMCLNCINAIINVHIFVRKLKNRTTFWEKALSSSESASAIPLPTNNDDDSIFDEKLLRIDEVHIKNENIDNKNADSEHADYDLIIKDETVGLNDVAEQSSDMPDYCEVHTEETDGVSAQSGDMSDIHSDDNNSDYKHYLTLPRLTTVAAAMDTNSIQDMKEHSVTNDDSKLEAKSATAGTKPTRTKKQSIDRVLCKVCGKMYSNTVIRKHIKQHTRPIQCDICGFTVFANNKLAIHAKEHDKLTDPLICRICESGHDNIYEYKNHMKIHNVERINYRDLALITDANKCKNCGKTYATAGGLRAHEQIHKKKTDRWCSYCQKGFTSKSVYQTHMRIHTGEKPFACPHCPKRYSQKVRLVEHMNNHENKLEYPCELCPKTYKFKPSLHVHRRRYHPELTEPSTASNAVGSSDSPIAN